MLNQQPNIQIVEAYEYLYDILYCIENDLDLPVDEIHTIGGRKSGKSTSVELVLYLLMCLDKKIGLIAFRASVEDSEELFNDICETWDAYDLEYKANFSKKELTVGINKFRIIGVNTRNRRAKAKKSGLSKIANVKYIVRFFEERFEFTETDVKAIKEAVRGISPEVKVQILDINACNPWAKSSEYITWCARYQQWDIKQLKETGNQWGIYDIDVGEGRTKRVIFHYTNWRINKKFLGDSEINQITDLWNIDRGRALVSDYGLPGYEDGAIYTDILDKIGKPQYHYQENDRLLAGGDYGWGTNNQSGKTSFWFGYYNDESGIDYLNEYVSDNHTKVKTPDRIAQEVVEFYILAMKKFCLEVGWHSFFNLSVRVDNMAVGFISLLNNEAMKRKCNWLRFTKCKKFPVDDRIDIVRALANKFMLRFNKSSNLYKELEQSAYDEGTTRKRLKVNDHSINAFEYGIEPVMYRAAKNLGLANIKMKEHYTNIYGKFR